MSATKCIAANIADVATFEAGGSGTFAFEPDQYARPNLAEEKCMRWLQKFVQAHQHSGTSADTDAADTGDARKITAAELIDVLGGVGSGVFNVRHRVTTAEMNAGHEILAALSGKKYRIIDCHVIAVGGAMAATANATGVAIYGSQTTPQKLYEVLLAAGVQSAICRPGTANTNILADGASFVQNDANTAITVKTVSAGNFDLITCTDVDVNITYALES